MSANLKIETVTEGSGAVASTGKRVSVHYKGMLADGDVFDASEPRGKPFSFEIGAGQVIPGWEQGVTGMKVGEVRELKIPADEGVSGEEFVHELAQKLFNGHIETAGARILRDYGKGSLGKFALELPPTV